MNQKSGSMLALIMDRRNVEKALLQVERNKGVGGVDGMQTDELRDYLNADYQQLRQEILTGSYEPSPVKKVEIPKAQGGVRMLGIPTVIDRLLQQAISRWLGQYYEPIFSAFSYGFRPNKNAHQAVLQAQTFINEGKTYVIELDLEKFFDKVNHDKLMSLLMRKVTDKATLRLIRQYLRSGILEDGVVSRPTKSTLLGFSFYKVRDKWAIRIANNSLERIREKSKAITKRNNGSNTRQKILKMQSLIQGWVTYFSIAKAKSLLQDLDALVRTRLRMGLWKEWKTGRTRVANLLKLKASKQKSYEWGNSSRGYCRVAHSPILCTTLNNAYFMRQGYYGFYNTYNRLAGETQTTLF